MEFRIFVEQNDFHKAETIVGRQWRHHICWNQSGDEYGHLGQEVLGRIAYGRLVDREGVDMPYWLRCAQKLGLTPQEVEHFIDDIDREMHK